LPIDLVGLRRLFEQAGGLLLKVANFSLFRDLKTETPR
jgi:hypothetical protein